ncbi:tail fiber assembly protein [Herbaspirillum sp. WKF16]|uniref:tail fiber assembly protein n=1 Tax=Herbaspirillum sp. WKF16 TaxID=3028312 RepID=UPI0023A91A67|nr:tail fiber assembly protein [Herbaspirillum sp. WKF16]WDZ97996.1 tail fiber assembly protein [Herbaspirillum sp. WKF16]
MDYFYSATTSGFYCEAINGTDIPADAKAITEERYNEVMAGQATGKRIVADADGMPVLADQLPPTSEQLAAQALLQRATLLAAAANAIAPLQDAVDLEIATDAEKAELTAWKQYRVALSRIGQQATYPMDIDWPEAPKG